MAESQLECMEDGRICETVHESRPEFYYSEEHRRALEELLWKGDGAFKTFFQEGNTKAFLSAREIEVIQSTAEQYSAHEDSDAARQHADDSTSLRSTYFPDPSDTEVPLLDLGWSQTSFFKGVTRVMVFTHPPKDNTPHIKEVVRRLIQEAHRVVAIVMDLLTDLQIIQDLLDAASRRGVAVYIILDSTGAPHFLDMFSTLKVGRQHLQNIRTRIVRGVGIDLSFGRIPGNLSNKYMLIDGDKVMFGSYSFSWSSSRMDRNIITIMSGQIVDLFDRDFRELYAISRELNLYKKFNVDKPTTATSTRVTVPPRPALPTTSRFQVSLGDRGTLKVPAHKYHNPKYLLALGNLPDDVNSPNDLFSKMEESKERFLAEWNPLEGENEMMEPQTQPSLKGKKDTKSSCIPLKKRKKWTFLQKSRKDAGKKEAGEAGEGDPGSSTRTELTPPTIVGDTGTIEDITEEPAAETQTSDKTKSKKKKKKKSKSPQSDDQGSESHKDRKKSCVLS